MDSQAGKQGFHRRPRRALRFEIPQEWLVEPSRKSIKFRDAEPPDDTMGLEVTIFYAGYGMNIDWSSLPLHQLIKDVTSDDAPRPPRPGQPPSAPGPGRHQARLADYRQAGQPGDGMDRIGVLRPGRKASSPFPPGHHP